MFNQFQTNKMIHLLVFSTLAVLTVAVDDKPSKNITLSLVELDGPLVLPKAEHVSDDKSEYEGRWHVAYGGLKKNEEEHVYCAVFDAFFDKDGNYHSFFNFKYKGETRVLVSEKKPDKPDEGIYNLYLGQPESVKMKTVLYYVDKDMIAIWDGLDKDGDKHEQVLTVGFRHIDSVSKKKDELKKIYSSLKKKKAPSQENKISHKDCKYPEAMKNPYKSE